MLKATDGHQLVAFGRKYPDPSEWNNVGFPIPFFEHCWITVSNNFATGIPVEVRLQIRSGTEALCNTSLTPSRIQVPVDESKKNPNDWHLWHAVEYQTVGQAMLSLTVGVNGASPDSNPPPKRADPEYIPRRWFARCRGRNDFLANVYFHLDGLFRKIRGSDISSVSDPGYYNFVKVSLSLSKYLPNTDGKTPDTQRQNPTAPESILTAVGFIWRVQEDQYNAVLKWATKSCLALRILQCQTMDAVFLNGVSALLTVYKAHATLYETIQLPADEGFREHCDLKTRLDQAGLDINDKSRSKKRKCDHGLVGPVVIRGNQEPYDEPDEPGLQVFSL